MRTGVYRKIEGRTGVGQLYEFSDLNRDHTTGEERVTYIPLRVERGWAGTVRHCSIPRADFERKFEYVAEGLPADEGAAVVAHPLQQLIAAWRAKVERRRADAEQLISVGEHERALVLDARADEGLLCADALEAALAAAEPPPVCVHGHTTRVVGCVSCVLVFDRPARPAENVGWGDKREKSS